MRFGVKKQAGEISVNKQDVRTGRLVQEHFGISLDECAKINGLEILYPSLAFQARDRYKKSRNLFYGSEKTDEQQRPEISSIEALDSAIRRAFEFKSRDGKPEKFKVIEAVGSKNYFMIGQRVPVWHAKMYAKIIEDAAPSFVHIMMDWAKRNHKVSLEGKFYGDALFDNKAHNKLVLYLPVFEVPMVASLLLSAKEMFEPVKLNHKFGVQLLPGVSVVLERTSHTSFDSVVDYAFATICHYNLEKEPSETLYRMLLEGTDNADGILSSNVTSDYFEFLVGRRQKSSWSETSQSTQEEDKLDRAAMKMLMHKTS
ncbi:MAG: hypothetical protein KGH61_01045 [Candidatus Micrarchaeota archaeon]|nr:hypothetical protein [Candidatus Micrarchaeota archaeon]MDE1847520.1 hypothetical protein [Candidatus Micrarchaeota archaeon]MDE1863844.1 hypothetical protein [Candidatus Micrarchaeota archaeon]